MGRAQFRRRRVATRSKVSDLATVTTERRYSDEEVAAIFERAAEAQLTGPRPASAGTGMTLAELQDIGRDVGLPAEALAEAARSLDLAGRPASRSFLGFPIGVSHVVDLGRPLATGEWERLVVDLRDTFDARGVVREDGAFRQWTNGNLQALVEPTGSGHRVRLRTFKGNARAYMTTGIALLAGAAVTWIAGALGGAADVRTVQLLAVIGTSLFGVGALMVPAWARTRRRQMAEIAERLTRSDRAVRPDAQAGLPPDGH